ncbi:MAG TPA: glutamine-hydrolyzing carbamoyl-phosphate synthase small subunit [Chloroflexota bacterium]|nr:glutamine-hydrolyzing carbamoyl-phosphate synthase small subunit [Chloroflexota bacterium]
MVTVDLVRSRTGAQREPERTEEMEATLLLADGTRFRGRGLHTPSGRSIVTGELIFTTAMTGYQEALTDPSYRGQLLMFTYPLIGNYGVAGGRAQSGCVQPGGVVVSTLTECAPSPVGTSRSLGAYLLANRVPVMYDVDTRALAEWIRKQGAMPAVLSVYRRGAEPSAAELQIALESCAYDRTDLVAETTVRTPQFHGEGRTLIAVLDCGNKQSVVDHLVRSGMRVAVLPATTDAAALRRLRPAGLLISNGPGNPAMAQRTVSTVRALYGELPMFGICLGHQVLALAAGGRTYKLKFGHRGANHPVRDCSAGKAFITTQNHGFAVDGESLPDELEVSHRNLNDGTVEGLRHRALPIRSVQFHPEGAPGPTDSIQVFDQWLEMVA